MTLRGIRCGRGLGDSLYLQAVVRHLVAKGERFKVRSDWPDVFRPLGDRVSVAPFSREVDIVAHYAPRKGVKGTTQFEDCCIGAGITGPVDLRLDWTVTDRPLVESLKARGKPILCVQLPRSPMGRTDGFGADLLPDCNVIQGVIDALCERALIVQIGAGEPLYKFHGIDVDLANKTSVSEMLDVASIAAGFLGFVSFVVPLAESFSKPALIVWSSRGLRSAHLYVRQIAPQKIIHRPSTVAVMDDQPEQIREAVDAFMR